METKFWACFNCGMSYRGSTNKIEDISNNHTCLKKGTERENISKIIGALQKMSSLLPPPIPPPLANLNTPKYRSSDVVLKQRGQLEKKNRDKMPESVVLELKTKIE